MKQQNAQKPSFIRAGSPKNGAKIEPVTFEWDEAKASANEKPMKKTEPEPNDELRPEYDLRSLRVRKLGSWRKSFGGRIGLEPDVAEVFPEADSLVANVSDESTTDSFDL